MCSDGDTTTVRHQAIGQGAIAEINLRALDDRPITRREARTLFAEMFADHERQLVGAPGARQDR